VGAQSMQHAISSEDRAESRALGSVWWRRGGSNIQTLLPDRLLLLSLPLQGTLHEHCLHFLRFPLLMYMLPYRPASPMLYTCD